MTMTDTSTVQAEAGGSIETGKSVEQRRYFPPWHRLALAAITLVSIFMNFFQLGTNGFANLYYAVGVRSMLDSWHNFFFVSYDPGGFVTIDKPPLGFWLQVASSWLFGFTPFSVFLPQALAGVLSVLLLYYLVRRHFGILAGLFAALALAVSPISVVTNRNNTIDSTLALVLLLGAWAVLRAAETGKLRWLLLSAAIVGLGFNVKMMEAYLVVPAFALLYLLAAPRGWLTRIGHLALAAVLLVAVSFSWAAAVDLTPATLRPYVGSTQDNSELSLALGYNGVDRLIGMFRGGWRGPAGPPNGGNGAGARAFGGTTSGGASFRPPFGNGEGGQFVRPGSSPGQPSVRPNRPSSGNGRSFFGGGGGMFGTGRAGPLRLFQAALGSQIGWLLPLALLGVVAVAWQRRPRPQADRRQKSLILWGAWLLTMGVFFSVAGFFHPYYLTVMAPAVAALVGIGLATMWRDYRRGSWRGWLLPLALAATVGEQVYLLSADATWEHRLVPPLVALAVGGAVALVAARLVRGPSVRDLRWMRLAGPALGIAFLALLAAPTVWAATPVIQNEVSPMPSAGPGPGRGIVGMPGPGRNSGVDSALLNYLEAHRGGAEYLVAVESSNQADPLILATNQPVMALGGFSGSDPILTTSQLAQLVASGKLRYALVAGSGHFGFMGGGRQSGLTQWIQAHGTPVPSSAWQSASGNSRFGGSQQLYALSV